jgi:hypothetical protein
MTTNKPIRPVDPAPTIKPVKPVRPETTMDPVDADPAMQGEGNITAARRHRQSAEKFVASGQVDQAAHDAKPKDAKEAADMLNAEKKGLSKAKK